MIFFLYGEDTFRSLRKLREIKKGYREKNESGLNLREIDLEKKGFPVLRGQFRACSMFSEKKLFVLRRPFADPSFGKKFLEEKERFLKDPNILVFFKRGEPEKETPLFNFLKEEAETQHFVPLEDRELQGWVRKEAEKHGLLISASKADLLIERVGQDLWALHTALAKTASYKDAGEGRKKRVREKEIRLLTKPNLEKDIFKTVDAIAGGEKGKALNLLASHLEEGDSPLYVLSMIGWQTTRLLAVKEKKRKGEDPRDLGWHSYVIRKSSRLARQFSLNSLTRFHDKILELDVKSKRGEVSPELALDLLVAEI